jgi:hypothetical protein
MNLKSRVGRLTIIVGFFALASALMAGQAAAVSITGRVLGGGAPIANSTVTLWAATAGAPAQLGQAKTGADGQFSLSATQSPAAGASLYLVAQGGKAATDKSATDNAAIALMAVLGSKAPPRVTINEFTTVASVWTHAQFLTGTAVQGHALGLSIAAGNVPNFVDVATGGYGTVIQDAINSTQTPTLANFATLANIMAACVTRLPANACGSFLSAATGPGGREPGDSLAAAESIARNAAYKPQRIFALLEAFYPIPQGKKLRVTPFIPYLSFAPSAWVLPLKFSGGGLNGPGKIMFDSNGNAWTGDNFIVGFQSLDAFWNGNLSEIAPNGRALSPMTTGFTGGGLEGPGFGTAVAADGKVWVDNTSGKTISLFDNNGKPLSPPEGYNFGGKLGLMQGIIVAPNGDVWALDFGDDKVVYLPNGDPSKVKFFCQSTDGKPNKDSPCKLNGPFHLAIDQQDRIWITNAITDTVTRFPASDPSQVQVFKIGGHSGKGMAIDSKGNAWITGTAGEGLSLAVKLHLVELKLTGNMKELDRVIIDWLKTHRRGNVTMLRPDGTQAPGGSVFNGGGATWAAWGAAIDGNDHVWISSLIGTNLVELCGIRTETCPPGMKTGDPISPPSGYVGGNMEWLTDVAVDPAGNVWVANNWQDDQTCFGLRPEAASTRCGGNGITIFYGMAKPVRAPQIGPARGY